MSRRPQAPKTPLAEAIEAAIFIWALLATLVMAVVDALG